MTSDPMLNSGRPWNPQTWNRCAYALNNPLAIIDPTGLYNLLSKCGQDDKSCQKEFKKNAENLRNALQRLQDLLKNVKDPVQRARLEAALQAIGTENDHNNVTVSFGKTSDGKPARTDPIYDQKTNTYSGFNMTFDPTQIKTSNDWAEYGAHEGTHVSDYEKYELNPKTAMWLFQIEYREYQTSAFAASALGESSLSQVYEGKSYLIWNGSWAVVDKNITNLVTKFRDAQGEQTHPEVKPHNPFPND